MSETYTPRPGRPSAVSKHPARPAIEAALVADTPVTAITAAHAVPERNLYRTKAALVREGRERAAREHESTVASFADRLTDIADQAERIRIRAEETNPKLATEAGTAEAAALRELADRYGITDETVVAELAEAKADLLTLSRVVMDVIRIRRAPLAHDLAKAANARGEDDLAASFTALAASMETHDSQSQKEK